MMEVDIGTGLDGAAWRAVLLAALAGKGLTVAEAARLVAHTRDAAAQERMAAQAPAAAPEDSAAGAMEDQGGAIQAERRAWHAGARAALHTMERCAEAWAGFAAPGAQEKPTSLPGVKNRDMWFGRQQYADLLRSAAAGLARGDDAQFPTGYYVPNAVLAFAAAMRGQEAPPRLLTPLTDAQKAWLANQHERGLSSNALFEHLTGHYLGAGSMAPSDISDFRRCHLMLEKCGLVGRIGEAAGLSSGWAKLVPAWGQIVASLDVEVPQWRNPRCGGSAGVTYRAMKALLAGETPEWATREGHADA